MKLAILGAGAMGSALAVLLAEKNHVKLWGSEYDLHILEKIKKGEEHPRIQVKIPENVEILYPQELKKAFEDVDIVILAVSTVGVKPMVEKIKPFVKNQILVTVTKGFVGDGEKILTVAEYLEKYLSCSIVAITGPSIAKEVANKNFTKVVFSSKDKEALERCKNVFETNYYKIELSNDVMGCELSSAFKNIYSIAIAWPSGMEKSRNVKMDNLRGIIITQTLKEISLIAEKFGGKRETVYGLSGIGDIIATIGGGRNGMFGELLGEGKTVEEALKILKERGVGVIEGYENIPKARKMIGDMDLPLFRSIYEVTFENKKVEQAIKEII